jgi:hypothetical protein
VSAPRRDHQVPTQKRKRSGMAERHKMFS